MDVIESSPDKAGRCVCHGAGKARPAFPTTREDEMGDYKTSADLDREDVGLALSAIVGVIVAILIAVIFS